jgi:hypothetical protein
VTADELIKALTEQELEARRWLEALRCWWRLPPAPWWLVDRQRSWRGYEPL